MKTVNINNLIALFGSILAVFTTFASAVLWYVNAEKRKYGLERDFNHMKRNYEQMAQSLNVIITELDHRFDAVDRSIIEIKATLNIKR